MLRALRSRLASLVALFLLLSFGAPAAEAAAVAKPAPIIPQNWEMNLVGDSRTALGMTAGFTATGHTQYFLLVGYAGWIPTATEGKVRVAQYGMFGWSGAQAANDLDKVPRTNGGIVSNGLFYRCDDGVTGCGSSNKGCDAINASSAGLVGVLIGTNDGGPTNSYTTSANWAPGGATRAAIDGFVRCVSPSKLIVIFNELPRGTLNDGTAATAAGLAPLGTDHGAKYKSTSDYILSLDYASGSMNARKNVVAVDVYGDALDRSFDTSGPVARNKAGYLNDGLHQSYYGARRIAELMAERLARVYGPLWSALPSQVSLPTGPTDAGLTTPSQAPFITYNPLLINGTPNGNFAGGFANSDPNCANANLPSGWQLRGFNASVEVYCSYETDERGLNVFVLTFGGSVAAGGSGATQITCTSCSTTVANNNGFVDQDVVRGVLRMRVSTGSNFLQHVSLQAGFGQTPNTRASTAYACEPSSTVMLYRDVSGARDAGRDTGWMLCETAPFSAREPGSHYAYGWGSPTSWAPVININFRNTTASPQSINGTVRIGGVGIYRTGQQLSTTAPTNPVYVGETNVATTTTSQALTLPAGSAAADYACIYAQAEGTTAPDLVSGWTSLYSGQTTTASNHGRIMCKALDSADITAGSIALTGTTANGFAQIAVFRGPTSAQLPTPVISADAGSTVDFPGWTKAANHFGYVTWYANADNNTGFIFPKGVVSRTNNVSLGSFRLYLATAPLVPVSYTNTAVLSTASMGVSTDNFGAIVELLN